MIIILYKLSCLVQLALSENFKMKPINLTSLKNAITMTKDLNQKEQKFCKMVLTSILKSWIDFNIQVEWHLLRTRIEQEPYLLIKLIMELNIFILIQN